jgi:hypothetical protein
MDTGVRHVFESLFSLLSVELLGHVDVLFKCFEELPYCFPQ